MMWLTLTAEVHNAQTKEVFKVKRRVNMDAALAYEPNAAGGTSVAFIGGIHQFDEPVDQIDAALKEEGHPLRGGNRIPPSKLAAREIMNEAMSARAPRFPFARL